MAFFIRFYHVGSNPGGVLIDEASFGYNAYSVLQTGKDEHGTFLPLIFKAFGDQKLPAYAYALVPFIWVFDLSTTIVRLPSVIAGTLITLFTFFLLQKFGFSKWQGILGSLIVAVSPWNIILSRFGYESNLGLLFLVIGMISIFSYLKQKSTVFLIISGLFFGLTWYSYIAYRLTIPLLLVGLLFLFFRSKKITAKNCIILIISFLIVISPLLPTVFAKEGTTRFNQIGIFSDVGIPMEINESRAYCRGDLPKIICYGLYNKPVLFSEAVYERFTKIFSPDYLFLNAEPDLHLLSVKHIGLFPIFLLPFFILGLFSLFLRVIKKDTSLFDIYCLLGLVASAIPSVLAGDPQRVRLSPLFPFILLTMMYGITFSEKYIRAQHLKVATYSTFIILLIVSGVIFMISYLSVHTKKYETEYLSHIPRLMSYIDTHSKNTEVYFSDFGYALYYYIYFTKPSPVDVQKYALWEKPGPSGIAHITDYKNIHRTEASAIDTFCKESIGKPSSLYVTAHEITSLQPIQIIKTYDNVFSLFYIYDIPTNRKVMC